MSVNKLLKLMLCVSFFLTVIGQPIQHSFVFAASNDSVEECIKNPDVCKDQSTPAVDSKNQSTAVGLSAWEYIKMVLALVFVIALLYGVLKFINSRNSKYQQNQLMQNLGGISLGQQKSVQLLKVGETLYLVGVGNDVRILKEVTDSEEKEQLLNLYNEKQELTSQVPYVAELISRFKEKTSKQQEHSQNKDFKEEFQKRLATLGKERQKELEDWKEKERENE